MLPSDINLNIRSGVVAYNNKILISDSQLVLGKNDKVNTLELAKINHKVLLKPTITHKNLEQKRINTHTITHEKEKVALILFLAGGSAIWKMFQ